MKRTLNQNNFYHAVIADVHKQALEKHVTVEKKDYLRNGLKEIDLNYPIKDGEPISSAKLTTKEMVEHIEFIIMFLGQFDICPKFVTDDWERIKKHARENYE
jgi:hypothetical protein